MRIRRENRAIFENKKGKIELHFRIRRENRATYEEVGRDFSLNPKT